MLIDTHAHLNFAAYDQDRDQVIERCRAKGMQVINVGANLASSRLATALADDFGHFYAAIGLHPIHVFDDNFDYQSYKLLITDKVMAVGETGFDYYHPTFQRAGADKRPIEQVIAKQAEVFLAQIRLAREFNLAVVCHGRNGLAGKDVYTDILQMLQSSQVERAVIHCFGGDLKTARQIVNHGYYIGIDGPVTFQNKAEELQKIAQEIPLDKILIETDCPYLTPEPHRGQRNEPIYAELVAKKIAELRNISQKEVIEQTWQNARHLFKLP